MKLNTNQKQLTAHTLAAEFLDSMEWQNEHFGFCTIPCDASRSCNAAFHFNGRLRVFCINEDCEHHRQYSFPADSLRTVAAHWNQPQIILDASRHAAEHYYCN